MKMTALLVLVGATVLLAGYVRVAPSDPARWHVARPGDANRDMSGGVIRVVETGPDGLARLDAIAQQSPRTSILAGSVDEGMVTYVTRTRWMGFPDYTTVQQDGDILRTHGRLRFGRRDFGVNRKRIDGWLALLQP